MLRVRRLGVVPYAEAYDLARALATRAHDDYLLVLEHPHVYTLGVRADPDHVRCDPTAVGADNVRTDRGGDVTYHGPGQLVVYPVVTLDGGPGSTPQHAARVEQVVIDALGDLDVRSGRQPGYPGVWLDPGTGGARKIAAIGIRSLRVPDGRKRTMHGVALNVECDMAMWSHIVPCGISEYPVTSLAAEGLDLSMAEVADAVVARAIAAWGAGGEDQDAAARPRARAGGGGSGERSSLVRLRQAGVDPGAGVALSARKPEWLRVRARMGSGFTTLGRTLRDLRLVTVCEEAGCPNIFECWAEGTATFMVNGDRCTRACGFCRVDTRRPLPLDPGEPERVAEAVDRMGLEHAVVTCVARDDLADGGAGSIAETVRAIRRRRPSTAVEVLISDCKGDAGALGSIFAARPDILNHNVETVERLQRAVRPSAGYARSLAVLARAADAGLTVKSGLMVGLGEDHDEVLGTLADLRAVGVAIVTVGQYLRPTAAHLPVARWWTPAELEALAVAGRAMGFAHVQASPLTRSSYHARGAAEAAGARPTPVHAAAGSPGALPDARAPSERAVPVSFSARRA